MAATARGWSMFLLVWIALDFGDPTTPGVFSLMHQDLFLDGMTRGDDELQDRAERPRAPDAPVAFEMVMNAMSPRPAMTRVVAWEPPAPRYVLFAPRLRTMIAPGPSRDTDDH